MIHGEMTMEDRRAGCFGNHSRQLVDVAASCRLSKWRRCLRSKLVRRQQPWDSDPLPSRPFCCDCFRGTVKPVSQSVSRRRSSTRHLHRPLSASPPPEGGRGRESERQDRRSHLAQGLSPSPLTPRARHCAALPSLQLEPRSYTMRQQQVYHPTTNWQRIRTWNRRGLKGPCGRRQTEAIRRGCDGVFGWWRNLDSGWNEGKQCRLCGESRMMWLKLIIF